MKQEVSRECRFVVHVPTRDRNIPDVHLIKEQIHYNDGTTVPSIRIVKDYQRPIWITKERFRNHKQKKEWEDVDKLYRKNVCQSNMIYNIAKMLDMGYVQNPRDILGSPYVYGADVHSSTFIKNSYKSKYPNAVKTPFTVAALDIETNVLNGTEDILMCTVAFNNSVYTVIDKNFLSGISNPIEQLKSAVNKYLKEYVENNKLEVEFLIVDNPLEVVKEAFKKLHVWKPDLLAIWNIDFDIPKILKQIEKAKADPKEILCDPSIEYGSRSCKYIPGPTKKITSSGVVKPLPISLQWHTLYLTASFYVIDAMCSYRRIRLAQPEKPSYSLDSILDIELGKRKLRFEETDQYSGLKWHQVMQSDYKLEYTIYNIFDSYSMIQLENKTKDLSYSLPDMIDSTPFNKASSQPSVIADNFFFYLYNNENKVLGCTGKTAEISSTLPGTSDEDEDEETYLPLSLKGWINTLSSHMMKSGLNLIEEDKTISTNIRCYVSDMDSVSAYPSVLEVANVAKETTVRELSAITGIEESEFRYQNLNVLSGGVDSIEYVSTMLDGLDLVDLMELELRC